MVVIAWLIQVLFTWGSKKYPLSFARPFLFVLKEWWLVLDFLREGTLIFLSDVWKLFQKLNQMTNQFNN